MAVEDLQQFVVVPPTLFIDGMLRFLFMQDVLPAMGEIHDGFVFAQNLTDSSVVAAIQVLVQEEKIIVTPSDQ